LLLAHIDFVLAHFALMLVEDNLPLSKLDFPLLQPAVAIAKLGVAVAELGVLLDVSNQLLLDQVDEEIDFLLAISTLADPRPRERDIVNIGRSENHVLLPKS
jgi:hypothetical protein